MPIAAWDGGPDDEGAGTRAAVPGQAGDPVPDTAAQNAEPPASSEKVDR